MPIASVDVKTVRNMLEWFESLELTISRLRGQEQEVDVFIYGQKTCIDRDRIRLALENERDSIVRDLRNLYSVYVTPLPQP